MKTTRFKAENNNIVNKITNKIIADSDLSKTGLPEEIIRKYNAVGVYTLVELLGIDEDLEEFVISYFNLNDKRNDIYKLILKYLRKCDEETVGGNPSNMTFDYLQRLDRLNSYITDDELEIVKTSLDQTIIDSDMFKQLRKGIIYDLMVTFQIFKWDNNTYVTRKYFDSIGVKIEVGLYNRICKKVYDQLNELYTVKYINEEVNKYIENSSDDFSSLSQFMKCLPFASFEIVHSTQYYMNKPFEFGGVMVFGGSKQIPSKEVNKYNFVKYLIESNKINSKNRLYEMLVDKYGIRPSLGEFNKVLNTIGFNPIPNEIVDISYADKVVENVPKLEVKTQKKAEDVKLEPIAKKKVKEVKQKIEAQIPIEEVKLQPETKNTTEEEKQKIEVQASVKEDEKEAITPIEASSVDLNDFVINKGLLKKYTGKNKDVVIPDGIEIIGGNSFINNKKIESVIIPDGVKEIRRAAFSGCINLKSVVLPSTITIIYEAAFEKCDNLYFKELPSSLKKIDCKIKIDQSVKSLVVPEGVEKLGYMALGGEYEEVYLPKSLMDLNHAALDSKVLKKIVVDPNNKVYDSRDDSNAVIETKTNTILIGCCGTIIPGSVKVIGEEAFEGKNITKLDIPDGVEKIGYIGLMYTELLKEINVSKTVVDMDTALDDEYLEHISVSRDNPVYYSDDNHTALIKKDNNKLLYLCKNKLIPNSVKIIGKNSIYSDSNYLVIPEGVEEIETDAFSGCYIYNYVLPSSLKVVKKDAFPSTYLENCKVTIMAIKSEMNMIPGGFENDWINYNQYEITWKEALNGKSKITEDDLKSRYYISYKCTASKTNVSILKDGTFIFSDHPYYYSGDSTKERPRIGVIEHGITDDSEYYHLYKDLNDREFCGNDGSKFIGMGILKEDIVLTKRIHGTDLLLKGEVNFDESSRKLKEFVDKIINYYGKDNIKVIEVDKRINRANNNINTTNYNNTSNNSYNSNSNANAANMGYNSYKGGALPPRKKGCYIATCVYGSYDCKEVWRLRRYRDFYLDNHWFGRAFIKIYYFISPKLVKLFGNQKWFKNISKKLLDKKISKLIDKGYEDTPYNDKY